MKKAFLSFVIIYFFFLTLLGQTLLLDKLVSIEQENTTIEKVLDELKLVYDIKFSYVNNLIPLQTPININLSEKPLYFVLNELFKATEISYSVVDSQIVLKIDSKKDKQANAPLASDSAAVKEQK